MHYCAFCQFSFRWIHYYGSNKSTRSETGKQAPLCSARNCINNKNKTAPFQKVVYPIVEMLTQKLPTSAALRQSNSKSIIKGGIERQHHPLFVKLRSLTKKKLAASTFNNRLSKVCNLKTNMDQLVRLLCSCIKDKIMEDADGDGVPDFMQKSKTNFNAFF